MCTCEGERVAHLVLQRPGPQEAKLLCADDWALLSAVTKPRGDSASLRGFVEGQAASAHARKETAGGTQEAGRQALPPGTCPPRALTVPMCPSRCPVRRALRPDASCVGRRRVQRGRCVLPLSGRPQARPASGTGHARRPSLRGLRGRPGPACAVAWRVPPAALSPLTQPCALAAPNRLFLLPLGQHSLSLFLYFFTTHFKFFPG